MNKEAEQTPNDWAGNIRAYSIVWGVPSLGIVAGSLVDVPARTAIWTAALIWTGTACLVNARRCGRTHCRFTGPFYLILTVPVLLLGFGALPIGPYAWWILGAAILFGGKIVWWATETAWGKFSKLEQIAPGQPGRLRGASPQSANQRSRTRLSPAARDMQGHIKPAWSRSASESALSRCRGVPSSTFTAQVPQVPDLQP